MLGDNCLQLAGKVGVPAERQVGLDPLLQQRQPKLVEAGRSRVARSPRS